MADTIQYGMGQIRYTNNLPYMSLCDFTYTPVNVLVSSSSESSTDVYQDVLLLGNQNFNFQVGISYLLKITIPKDLNYNSTYKIKLVASPNNSVSTINPDNITYQMLKYINVPKETGNSDSSNVIIYPVTTKNETIIVDGESKTIPAGTPGMNQSDNKYETRVAIALDKNETPEIAGNIYFNNNKYYIYVLDENQIVAQEIQNKNDVILNHSWTSGHSNTGVTFNFIFTPRDITETYNQIWIEMFRESYDQDIHNNNVYGRKIDLDAVNDDNTQIFQAEVYALQNLIGWENGINDVNALTHIGIYSHPNTIMAINGEEIRVGQSGYYELNNFEITSFGIAAEKNNNNDKFIMDYQYQIITS